MRRCPACGTVVADDRSTCNICGSDLLDVQEEHLDVAVPEEEKSEATEEKTVQPIELPASRKKTFARVILGVIGCALLITATFFGNTPPTVYESRFGGPVSVIASTLVFAGLACIVLAAKWDSFFTYP